METKNIVTCLNLAQLQIDQMKESGITEVDAAWLGSVELANIETELDRLQAENKLLKQQLDDRETTETRMSDIPL